MAETPEKVVGTIREAAEVLNVGINTAYEAARQGQIPTMQVGRRKLVKWKPFMRQVQGEVA